MDPRNGGELTEEQAALDQRALCRARVLEVAVPRLHVGHVLLDERQLPVALTGPDTRGGDLVIPGLRRPEGTRDQVAKCPRDRAGQRGDVHQMGRTLALRPGHRIAQDQATLGIGVDDVHLLAVERSDDVTGTRGVRAGHVLDCRCNGKQRRAGREARDRLDRGDHRTRPGLVHLHLVHPIGRLDADAARVEADTLADDGEVAAQGITLAGSTRAHHDHLGRVVAALADGHEHPHPELGRSLRSDDLERKPVTLGDRPRLLGKDERRHLDSRAIGQRARGVRSLADDHAALCGRGYGGRVRAGQDKDEFIERRRSGDVAPVAVRRRTGRFGRRPVQGAWVVRALDDPAGDQTRHQRCAPGRSLAVPGESGGGRERLEPDGHGPDRPATQSTFRRGADPNDRLAVERGRIPDADRDEPLDR